MPEPGDVARKYAAWFRGWGKMDSCGTITMVSEDVVGRHIQVAIDEAVKAEFREAMREANRLHLLHSNTLLAFTEVHGLLCRKAGVELEPGLERQIKAAIALAHKKGEDDGK